MKKLYVFLLGFIVGALLMQMPYFAFKPNQKAEIIINPAKTYTPVDVKKKIHQKIIVKMPQDGSNIIQGKIILSDPEKPNLPPKEEEIDIKKQDDNLIIDNDIEIGIKFPELKNHIGLYWSNIGLGGFYQRDLIDYKNFTGYARLDISNTVKLSVGIQYSF
jgi:hypothetical protein